MGIRDRAISIGLAGYARQVSDGPCLMTEIDILGGAGITDALQESLCHGRPTLHGRGIKLCHFLRSLRFHSLFMEYSGKYVKQRYCVEFSSGYLLSSSSIEILYEKTLHHKMQGSYRMRGICMVIGRLPRRKTVFPSPLRHCD